MPIWLGGRGVYINTQKSQTVKICTTENTRGLYEKYYRIDPSRALQQDKIELTISRFTSVADLENWLLTDMKAARERDNEQRNVPFGQDLQLDEPQHGSGSIVDGPSYAVPEHIYESEPSLAVAEVLDLLSSAKYSPNDDPWL